MEVSQAFLAAIQSLGSKSNEEKEAASKYEVAGPQSKFDFEFANVMVELLPCGFEDSVNFWVRKLRYCLFGWPKLGSSTIIFIVKNCLLLVNLNKSW